MKHLISAKIRAALFSPHVLYPLILLCIELLLLVTNYRAGTYLIGWDTVMPEFNLPLNFERAVTSLWQEYRGLGVLDGMAHSANLLHTFSIWLLSLFLPQSLLRYTFIHLTHLLGGIGMYYLLKSLLTEKSAIRNSQFAIPTISAFAGALFYMFNLGIIQMYQAPLEVFAVHFAALPFLTLQTIQTLKNPSRRNLLLVFFLALLFTPQSFVPTVFIAFSLLMGSVLLFSALQAKKIKPALLIGTIFLLANAFWLLPYTYSAVNTPHIIRNTKINQLASEEIFYRNKAHGDLLSVFSLRGFMLSTVEYDVESQKDVYLMQRWVSHSSTILYRAFFLALALIMLIGIYHAVREKKREFYPFLAVFFLGFLFLANNTPGIEQVNTLFRTALPTLGEAFRFPFTKFITVFAFCYTLFFALGLLWVFQTFNVYKRALLIVLTVMFLYLTFPVFQGYFTSPLLRLTLPDEYHRVFSYFKDKDATARISLLPVHTFWNWQYRSWNYRGSDFLWYGLPQPILERSFDPWSLTNEQYFTEISSAINRQDAKALAHVLQKYDVTYLLVDTSILNTLSRQPINFDSLLTFLEGDAGLIKEATFGKLLIYRNPHPAAPLSSLPHDHVVTIPDAPLNGPTIGFESTEATYTNGNQAIIAPLFPSLSTEKPADDLQFRLHEHAQSFVLESLGPFPRTSTALQLSLPSLFSTEFLVPVELQKTSQGIRITPLYPEVKVNGYYLPIKSDSYTIRPQRVTNPVMITMTDIDHVIPFTTGKAKTYLLNPATNTLKLSDGSREEIIAVSTDVFSHDAQLVGLPLGTIDSVEVAFPKFSSPFEHTDLIKKRRFTAREIKPLLPSITGKRSTSIIEENAAITLSTTGSNAELAVYLDNLYHQGSYLMLINSTYHSGLPVNFYADNPTQKRAEIETALAKDRKENIIILPRTEDFFRGYGFHLIVKSMGQEKAAATISDVDLYPIPLEFLQRLVITPDAASLTRGNTEKTARQSTHPTLASYTTQAPDKSLVILSQSYDEGWKAYEVANSKWQIANSVFPFLFGEEIKTHTKVNNWANGWTIPNNSQFANRKSQIVVVYLPQYLQYLGFGLTISTLFILLLRVRRGKKS